MTVFYELIDETFIIFLFLLQSLFPADKNVVNIFFISASLFCCRLYRGLGNLRRLYKKIVIVEFILC